MKLVLKLYKVSKTYQNKTGFVEANKDISMSVMQGEIISITGQSGCGKSTLLRLISGLENLDKGKILFSEATKNKIGMVFQKPNYFPWLGVRKNIEFGLRNKSSKSISDKLIRLVELEGFEEEYPHTLSQGMLQRVNIATTLATNPSLLLLDEPFSSLDSQTRSLMQELILRIWKKTRVTIIFVTHDIEEAIFLSDRIFLMNNNPSTIKQVINVSFPRPRNKKLRYSREFVKLKEQLSDLLEEIRSQESMDVIVKPSPIDGKGIFANRDYKKGEIVLKWDLRYLLTKRELNEVKKKGKNYTIRVNNKCYLLQSPERYMNHSCEANTKTENGCDIAIRDIKKGEEITANYFKEDKNGLIMKCNCHSPKCRGIIRDEQS